MLQHPTDNWTWGRYVVVHPAGNCDIVDACARYRAMLADDATFATMTLEQLLATDVLGRPDGEGAARPLPVRLRGCSQTSSMRAIGALSPWRGPSLRMRR